MALAAALVKTAVLLAMVCRGKRCAGCWWWGVCNVTGFDWTGAVGGDGMRGPMELRSVSGALVQGVSGGSPENGSSK